MGICSKAVKKDSCIVCNLTKKDCVCSYWFNYHGKTVVTIDEFKAKNCPGNINKKKQEKQDRAEYWMYKEGQ